MSLRILAAGFFSLLLIIPQPGHTQAFPNLEFSRLTESDGLSGDYVVSIAQDRDGFIWISTTDGLNRFDGYQVRTFFHRPHDSSSLLSNNAGQVVPDKRGNIWIVSADGLSYYDKMAGRFFNRQKTGLGADRFDGVYPCLYTDRLQQRWAYDSNCLFLLKPEANRVVATYSLPGFAIASFYQDRRGSYWVGSIWGGVFRFDPDGGRFVRVNLRMAGNIVYSITDWEDIDHRDWIVLGTNRGLTLVDPLTLASKDYLPRPFDALSLTGGEVHAVFSDRQHVLWVATDKGVSYAGPSRQLISSRTVYVSNASNPVNPGFIYSCYRDSGIFYATNWESPGLYRFTGDGPLQRIAEGLCALDFQKMPDGKWWFTTDLGMVHYDPVTHRATLYRAISGAPPAGLRNIVRYNDSLWWIRTRNNGANGIYVFNIRQRRFVAHYFARADCADCLPPRLSDLIMTRDHRLYTCPAEHFIYTYDPGSDRWLPLIRDPGSLPSLTCNCLSEDAAGALWIGTPNGLLRFDPVHRRVLRDYSGDKTLGGVDISRICPDGAGNIWMTSERGLFCLIPRSGKVYHFDRSDGLPTNSFPGMLVRGNGAEMLAGAAGYLIRFDPAALLHDQPDGSAHFSDATIMDQPAAWESGTNGARTLTLRPGQNIFSVDFAVLNYDKPGGTRFFYKLEGANPEWKENANGHLNFYNLAPGHYILHVRGGSRFGDLYTGEDSLDIVVQPAWWQTVWFLMTCVCMLALSILLLIRRRIAAIRREATVRQKIAETEMMALRAQMNPHFIFNSLNSIENFIMHNEQKLASGYLNKFAQLIRIILESSRTESVDLQKDLEALQLYVDLEQLRFNNKFTYTTHIEPALAEDDYRVPPLLIQPFVENAIVHGLAHSNRKDLQLQVSATRDEDYIRYVVEDNGIGRKRAGDYNRQYHSTHRSVGLLITRERIELFNRRHHSGSEIRIFDLFDDREQPAGTRVVIKIKPA